MKLKVTNKNITRIDAPQTPIELVSDNSYVIEFELDDEWDNKTVTVRASKGYDEEYTDSILSSQNTAVLNLSTGTWYISVWAAGLTSKPYEQYFEVSGKSFNGMPAVPESPYYEQLLDRMDEIEQGVISPEVITQAVNDYLDEHPVEGVDADTVNALIAQYLEDNPIESLDASAVNALIAQYLEDNPVDAYTKTQTDSMLADKANASTTYTKSETNALIPEVPVKSISLNGTPISPDAQGNVALSVSSGGGSGTSIDAYTKTETNTLLNAKADKSTTYTKTEVDTALSDKANASTTYTKTEVDTALASKASASTTYTKSETDALIPNVPIKSISLNGATVSPDAQGNVALSVSGGGGSASTDVVIKCTADYDTDWEYPFRLILPTGMTYADIKDKIITFEVPIDASINVTGTKVHIWTGSYYIDDDIYLCLSPYSGATYNGILFEEGEFASFLITEYNGQIYGLATNMSAKKYYQNIDDRINAKITELDGSGVAY